MAKRESGYARKERDAYNTPAWVTLVLIEELRSRGLLPLGSLIWEPAAGPGKMAAVLRAAGLTVFASDIAPETPETMRGNFLSDEVNDLLVKPHTHGIITNPPYVHATEFVEHALELTEPRGGLVAMLLPVDFDSAKGRRNIFADHAAFGLKIALTDRITWFEPELPPPGVDDVATPSDNHAWFVWDWGFRLGRSLAYCGAPEAVLDDLSRKRSAIRRQIRERNRAAVAAILAGEEVAS